MCLIWERWGARTMRFFRHTRARTRHAWGIAQPRPSILNGVFTPSVYCNPFHARDINFLFCLRLIDGALFFTIRKMRIALRADFRCVVLYERYREVVNSWLIIDLFCVSVVCFRLGFDVLSHFLFLSLVGVVIYLKILEGWMFCLISI